ncbi:MAG: S9 family peptidase [Gemmatimonadota bacterium]|nr:MAG: S9 family peptidase [Gemmatimonadota bacterium]
MHLCQLFLLAIIWVGVEGSALAQEGPRPMTVEDVLELRSVGDPRISPDGGWVAYVVTEIDFDENASNSDIWIVSTDGGSPFQLTRGPKRDSSPEWAPDGSWLAFLSNRDGKTQVYGIAPNGGEAWVVTDWETGVNSFRIAPDGGWIAFTASAEKREEDEELEKLRGEPIVWDSSYATAYSHLWVAPLDEDRRAGAVEQSSPDTLHVSGFVWAPDSRALAWDARPSPILRTYPHGDVFVQDKPGGEVRRVTRMPGGEGVVEWTAELGLIVAGSGHELGTFNYELWCVPESGGEPVSLTANLDEHARFVRAGERELLVDASYRTGRRLYRIRLRDGGPQGDAELLSDDRLYLRSFSASRDGSRLAFIAEGPSTPPDVFVSSSRSWRPRRLTEVNPQVAGFALGEHRIVSWPSAADGEQIEGVLTLPVGYGEGDRVPVLLVIHGGPAGVSSDRFTAARGAYPVQVFAGLGYAILQPNYRGSTGYGERFRGLNRGDISGRDWIDIDSGIDYLIETGIADAGRLGIMGWSFGGHHTYWGITQTDRYAAASAGAGANDLVSMYSQTDIPEFYHTYLGPKPWEDFELYEERSAYRNVTRVTTPLLIQVGEQDERVPAEQSIQFFEAVKTIGKAPVTLVVYPGEPHGVRSPRHRRDLMSRNVEWFTRWIPVSSQVTPAN